MFAFERLSEIDRQLKSKRLSVSEISELKIERIWLSYHIGEINQDQRIHNLARFLEKLEKNQPDVYRHLTQTDESETNLLMRIARNSAKKAA